MAIFFRHRPEKVSRHVFFFGQFALVQHVSFISVAFLSQWLLSTDAWRSHVGCVCARGDRFFHQSSAWCHGGKSSPSVFPFRSSTPPSCPVSLSAWNMLAMTLRSCLNSFGVPSLVLATTRVALGAWHWWHFARSLVDRSRCSAVCAPWMFMVLDLSVTASSNFLRMSLEDGLALRVLSMQHPGAFGISAGSQPSSVARWFAWEVTPRLEHDFHHRQRPWCVTSTECVWTSPWTLDDPRGTIQFARGAFRFLGPVARVLPVGATILPQLFDLRAIEPFLVGVHCATAAIALSSITSPCGPHHSVARTSWAHSCGMVVNEVAPLARHP